MLGRVTMHIKPSHTTNEAKTVLGDHTITET
jgi:hypothetical protein